MDNFDKIIKEKVEQFEVPYNDAHWAEMEGKLNSIKTAKIRNNILGIAAGVIAVGLVGYFMFPPTVENNANLANAEKTELQNTTENKINETNNSTTSDQQPDYKEEKNTITPSNEANTNEESETIELPSYSEENSTNEKTENDIVKTHSSPVLNSQEDEVNINAGFIVYNNRVCVGEEVSFESMDTERMVSYLWNFGDGTISNKTNPKHKYKESTTYTVTLTLIDKLTGKEFTTIQEDVVTILPSPETQFTYFEESKKHDDNKLKYPYTSFNLKGYDKNSSYQWRFGNGESSTSGNTKTIYKKAGNYPVTLVVKNTYGCSMVVEKKVSIKNGINLYAPSAFSPNQDNDNETFIPKALLGWDVQFEMKILSITGKTVYTTSDKNEPWNGKLNNTGIPLENGIYLWQVVIYDAEGTPHNYQDKVNLIR